MKLKHLSLVSGETILALEDSNSQDFIGKATEAFKELKTSFSKKVEASSAKKALADVTAVRAVLVKTRQQLDGAKFKSGQEVNIAQALSALQMTASSPKELNEKLKKRIVLIRQINMRVLQIEGLKNARMPDEMKEAQAKKQLKALQEEYKALLEKPAGSAKMAFTKPEVQTLLNLGVEYCDTLSEYYKDVLKSKIVMEDITDGIQSFFDWVVELVMDITGFVYSIFSGIIKFIVGIMLVIFFLANPVAGVIIFLGSAIILEIIQNVRERNQEEQ